jgi:CheY-like chemotaxis protein
VKILIADDDPVTREALRAILLPLATVQITEVENGQAALDSLCDGLRPDLCIFDLNMPHLGGLELLQRIRRDPILRGTKVVVTSATRDRQTIVALAKLQISGYLLKPYDPAKVSATIEPLLPREAPPSMVTRNLLERTLLIVDDDPIVRECLKGFASIVPNWTTILATNGREALERLRAGLRPDLILSDIGMPHVDGIELLQTIRKDPSLEKLRVAVMSANQDREQLATLTELKMYSFVLKPCTAGKLQELLGKIEHE